jgi:hypothetical protein
MLVKEKYVSEYNGLYNKGTNGFVVDLNSNRCRPIKYDNNKVPDPNLQCGGYDNTESCMRGFINNRDSGPQVLQASVVCNTCTR